MSPEQAKGRLVDSRSDIFAFGCLLYEMLIGKKAFDGEDVTEILSRVLQREPDWSTIPAATPSSVRRLLRLCLEKDVRKRRQNAGDVRIDIDQSIAGASDDQSHTRKARGFWPTLAAGLLIAALFVPPAVRHFLEPSPEEMRLQIVTPCSSRRPSSPFTGREAVAFVASGMERWLWPDSDKSEVQPIAGAEGADFPFWSAMAGRSAFQLRKVLPIDATERGVRTPTAR
jgi:serine/threonine protein kinase